MAEQILYDGWRARSSKGEQQSSSVGNLLEKDHALINSEGPDCGAIPTDRWGQSRQFHLGKHLAKITHRTRSVCGEASPERRESDGFT